MKILVKFYLILVLTFKKMHLKFVLQFRFYVMQVEKTGQLWCHMASQKWINNGSKNHFVWNVLNYRHFPGVKLSNETYLCKIHALHVNVISYKVTCQKFNHLSLNGLNYVLCYPFPKIKRGVQLHYTIKTTFRILSFQRCFCQWLIVVYFKITEWWLQTFHSNQCNAVKIHMYFAVEYL